MNSAMYPNGFELFTNQVTDNKIEPTYILRLSKLYSSGDVLESELSKDVEALIVWASKL
ncbi:hypothetical protein [Vallitalea guaymasensis]|uniref:hypothetical protein n=1 Tax=Vallitalea guaymasensis TaxID=1185412 RepID=UPI0023576C18|nr:hypothetical protein [Vallitalea guaymasensis]